MTTRVSLVLGDELFRAGFSREALEGWLERFWSTTFAPSADVATRRPPLPVLDGLSPPLGDASMAALGARLRPEEFERLRVALPQARIADLGLWNRELGGSAGRSVRQHFLESLSSWISAVAPTATVGYWLGYYPGARRMKPLDLDLAVVARALLIEHELQPNQLRFFNVREERTVHTR